MRTSIFSFNKSIPDHNLIFLLVFMFFVLDISLSYSQDEKGLGNIPIHITADKMVTEQGASIVEFMGNVTAIREDATILADSIKIFFAADKKNNTQTTQGNIHKILSTGNVRYTAGERKAFSDEAVYTTADEILVLTGKAPRLVTGTSFITGKKITIFRKQDRVEVESDGTKRVEALFNPEDNTDKKQ